MVALLKFPSNEQIVQPSKHQSVDVNKQYLIEVHFQNKHIKTVVKLELKYLEQDLHDNNHLHKQWAHDPYNVPSQYAKLPDFYLTILKIAISYHPFFLFDKE